MSEVTVMGTARSVRRAQLINVLLNQLQTTAQAMDLASTSPYLQEDERSVMAEISIDLEGQMALLAEAFPAKS
jgi:hypothetical protein